ncbi:flippase-like domain-containing protein [Methyloversatilis sp. XJ19-13]|uniref:lysylphosphatidylglycerol synthase transmembrane domain-containing protein n=1 Tax=Methyloversatilis sp. XJ19-13 TaxID=2963430 RepID=UPI00211B7E0A|nr:lysylphosphatidylglycerol synthase transmembrane domain-containing protein [Methyloversatilis sp. XJ19-13]MCQ9374559.1 flippase-like domain-containing protein [Methyloversatilis sp. XJ19-13]
MTRGALLRPVAACVLLAVVVRLADPWSLADVLLRADRDWLLAGLAAALLSNVASALRWRALTAWLGATVSPLFALLTYFRAMSLNALLPGAVVGGDLYRALALRKAGLPALDAGLSVLLDRVSGLWMLLAIGAVAAPFAAGSLTVALRAPAALIDLLGATVPLLLLVAPLLLIARPLTDVHRGRPVGALARIQSHVRRAGALQQYALQMGASLVVQALSVGALACGGRALGLDLPGLVWVAAAAPIFLMAALPVSVGGWGTREAAAAAVLAAFGVPAAEAVGAALVYGVFGLLQAALGGALLAWQSQPLSRAG